MRTIISDGKGHAVGHTVADLAIVWRTQIKSREFTAEIFFDTTYAQGLTLGLINIITTKCEGTCVGTGEVAGPSSAKGQSFTGKLNYRDQTPQQEHNKPIIIVTPEMPVPGAGMPAAARATTDVRCDDLLKPQGAGCVVPEFTPTITSLHRLRFIDANIRQWQGRGAPKVLHRNSFLKAGHRSAVCGKAKLPQGWRPPAGWPLPLSDPRNKPSCDEYAFAATNEGGTRPGNGYDWVPKREQDSQGADLKNFFDANRVLDAASARTEGDAFNVDG
ncbi:NucA/NucB deoxyribonuclease domain-containing protein [Actinomadura sp. NEAU-AAG7]|uniref:NucA/NucB deoxyribonuclease domain-containing protein n=1 Tax=Actinomadura sp. NEAU-AAG7 TaxID=2839640 RepID=UPI001BE3F467|nr:hypothetical protein [Actinomadura sp. NEAU-AAG7]MBT2212459.1 hypothetical protein [Actinomadura sp. NEAU-AAG7]